MAQLFIIVGWGLAGFSLLGSAYALFAAVLVRRFMAGQSVPAHARGPVTILKPLHGDEPGLFENLESFCRQDYAAPLQIVFGVHDDADPATAVVKALKAKYPALDMTLVADGASHGANGKISNLINMQAAARHDILVLADSDIAVKPHWLTHVCEALSRPGVGVVTCLYTGEAAAGADGLWSKLAAMGSSYDFLPNVVVGTSLGLAAPCFGSTIALARKTLDEIGGFAAFADCLADDYHIGRAAREAGYTLAMPALGVAHTAAEPSFGALFRHEQRWRRTIHSLDPAGNAGSIVTFTFAFALMSAALLDFAPVALLVLAVALAARLLLKQSIDRAFGTNAGPAWLMPLRDLLSFAVFVNSLFGETVHWRGARFGIDPAGAMSQI
ncbi:MAG: bacteriohopanetetrol glucosamine biosynthesis glycosyltransferase HpnI [Alphaproteobacteria bacterium]|nr:bacteriohopanetetrol glucosamine biosynthesis glycosyltransferase HpnI [Alphaproteobacteria bacterium]